MRAARPRQDDDGTVAAGYGATLWREGKWK